MSSWIRAGLRVVTLAITGSLLTVGLALADPQVGVDYKDGVPQVRLDGSYPGSRYTVYRSDAASGRFAPISQSEVLCLGECFADDFDAIPGRTYWYRFDLWLDDGRLVSFGPYAVNISAQLAQRVAATAYPNPGRSQTSVRLFLAGAPSAAPLDAAAELFDLQGRSVRTFHRGPLGRGVTRIAWDGRDRDGHTLGSGVYFLRFTTPLGGSVTRIVRAH